MDPGIVKGFIVLALVVIVGALVIAAFGLVRRPEGRDPTATVKALTVRIALSVTLLVVIIILVATGVISPSGQT